jgi:hypothetical protein
MKVLSIQQPWAYLLASGKKDVENRVWKTNYRGTVLIHATRAPKQFTPEQCAIIQQNMTEAEYTNACNQVGEIIGKMNIKDCVQGDMSKWAERNCWNWKIEKASVFDKPIKNIKGKLMLWNYDLKNN